MGKGNDTSIAYGQNDKVFAISNHQHFLNDYLAGNASNSFDFLSKLSGHPIGFFLDIHKLLSTIAGNSSINDEDEKVVLNESLSLWKDIYVTGGDFKDGGITSSTEVNFMDQNTNSLKQLNHYFDVIAKTIMDKMEKEKSGMNNIDSLIVPPPMDTVGHK